MKRFVKVLLAVFTALLFCGNAYSQDYIEINGLRWDKKNTSDGSEMYFTQDQAIDLATKHGKRLPTVKEFEALAALGSTWDDALKGRWFGTDHHLKSNSKKSIFFPASGYRNYTSGAFYNVGSSGCCWSSSDTGDYGYSLGFSASGVNPAGSNYRADGFPVRCIQE